MFYNAILVVIPATVLAGVTGDLQKVFQACRCMLLYTLLIALQLLIFLPLLFSLPPPPPSYNFFSSSCFPLFSFLYILAFLLNYLILFPFSLPSVSSFLHLHLQPFHYLSQRCQNGSCHSKCGCHTFYLLKNVQCFHSCGTGRGLSCSQATTSDLQTYHFQDLDRYCWMAGLSVIAYIKTVPIQMSSVCGPTFV